MAVYAEIVLLPVPAVRATRWTRDTLYTGVKEHYVVGQIERGQSEWWSRGEVLRGGPGTLLLQEPGDVHRDIARDGMCRSQILAFAPDVVEKAVGKVHVIPRLDAGDPRGAAFERLHDAVRTTTDRLTLEVAITEAITAFGSIGGAKMQQSRAVRRAMELMRERLGESITLEDLAAYADLDKFHLCRAFREQVGFPPHAYLTHLRIIRAKALLGAGMRPATVATRVGLYDQSQLNRHFRRIVGTTPGVYAKARYGNTRPRPSIVT